MATQDARHAGGCGRTVAAAAHPTVHPAHPTRGEAKRPKEGPIEASLRWEPAAPGA